MKTPTDTGDRRAKSASKMRSVQKVREALGMCKYCGKVPVLGRKICFACIDRHTKYVERAVFKKYGVPMPAALLLEGE